MSEATKTIGELVQEAFGAQLKRAMSRTVDQYEYLVQMMRNLGLETDKTGSLEDYGFDMLVAMFAQGVREANERAVEIESRTSKAMHELAKVHDILDAECKALGVEWQGGNAGTLQAVLAKLKHESIIRGSFEEIHQAPRIVEHVFWNDEFNRANTAMFDFNYAPCDILEELPPAPSVEEPEGEAPATPAETGEAAKWEAIYQINNLYHLNTELGVPLDAAESAADWLNRRAEIEAQLATYKQQAEAWEAVKRHQLSVCREFGEQNFFASFSGYSKCADERYRTSYADPAEAVFAISAQLESQQPSDGK